MKLSTAILTSIFFTLAVQGQGLEIGKCTRDEPCGECEADCKSDVDCEGDLVCFQQYGRDTGRGSIPGCSVVGTYRVIISFQYSL